MDSAVVRVKRRITDEPFDKFVLNCKRAKLCESFNDENQQENVGAESDAIRTILKFAATINAEDDIGTHLTKLRKPEAEELVKKVRKPSSVIAKLRQQLKDDAKEQRYKVVNCFRSMNETSSLEGAENTAAEITVVDVIKEEDPKATIPTPDTKPTGSTNQLDPDLLAQWEYVYDLYLFESGEQPTEINPNDYISIRPFDDLVYQAGDECLNVSDSNDSEDSNVEGNYRNDYPDTESDFGIDDDDIRFAVENLDIITNEESSSDDDYGYDNDPSVSIVENLDASTGDEYEYFQRRGRYRKHLQFYRNNQLHCKRNSDSDSESYNQSMSTDKSSSSSSQASPLVSCNEDN